MIIFCEECGKRYRIDPAKIRGAHARVRCKACGHVFDISKSDGMDGTGAEAEWPGSRNDEAVGAESIGTETVKAELASLKAQRARRLGLRAKMIILFFLVPVILVVAAGLLYIRQLDQLTALITSESGQVVTHLAENIIKEKAESVASQVLLYLDSHRKLKKENFFQDEEFKKIAVQKVGVTGYTALYQLPDSGGIWRTWAHVNPKIIGIDMSKLKKPLGKAFPGFWKVYTGVKEGKESKGYYRWKDKDGRIRDKFMVCTPVGNTSFVVAATTYLDEFTKEVKGLEKKAGAISANTKNAVFVILGSTLVLIALIVLWYGHALTKRIKSLTVLAEQISLGALDEELEIRSKDEIGDLGEAIGRMQESIRLSMERLRRRR
ncbi:MAG: zinc-ribbon domain-containing protein [Deltaproteobacteria bacterium]|nr:zinc-ribbon domain-containing protein [Deltaproteobacteria bacterium]